MGIRTVMKITYRGDYALKAIFQLALRYSEKDMANCIFRGVWQEVALATSKVVDNLTLADLLLRYKEKRYSARSGYEYAI